MQFGTGIPYDDAANPRSVIAWTRDQMIRLEHDWRQLQRSFAYHPAIKVIPLHGNPPAEYEVRFNARTLYIREDGQLDYMNNPSVHIWLPPGFPHEAPLVRPLNLLFHPNITMEGIAVNPAWDPTRTLAQLVQQLGALIAYQTYDPWNVWNPAAMDWASANAEYLPTDPAANFAPNAGGEPLGRICQHGERTIQQLGEQLRKMCESLLAPEEVPSAGEIRSFAQQIRLETNLFLENDIPDSLRAAAAELDQWAEALPSVTMLLEGLRQRHIAINAALAAAGKVAESRRVLIKELAYFDELVIPRPSPDARQAIAQLPDLPKMQAVQANFRVVANEAEKRLAAARARLAALSATEPRSSLTHSELLERFIEGETGRVNQAMITAQEKSEAAISALVPLAERTRDELAAFDRVIGWRELADLSAKSRELIDRILEWGSAGVQAYFVENEGGAFGPFEFEQRLDLGESALAVRNTSRSGIEVFDIISGGKVAQSDIGEATINLPSGEPGISYPTTFRITARCDELLTQLEYLSRQINDALAKLVKPTPTPRAESWVASFDKVLSSREAIASFVEETHADLQERNTLVSDLKSLCRFKERMTTQFLLERHGEMVPRFKKDLAEAQKELDDANKRIATIFAKSQRDLETNLPMIPPRLAKDYENQTRRRDDNQRKIERLKRRFKTAIKQIWPRLASPVLYGSDDLPNLTLLSPLPEDSTSRVVVMIEPMMQQQIAALEQLLGTRLRPDTPLAPEEAVSRPFDVTEALEMTSPHMGQESESTAPSQLAEPGSRDSVHHDFATHQEPVQETEAESDWIDLGPSPKTNG